MPSIGASIATTAWTSARTSPVWIGMLYGSAGGRPGLEGAVDQQAPDLLERDAADELLDVDAAVAQRRALLVGLGDLGRERDHALEALVYLRLLLRSCDSFVVRAASCRFCLPVRGRARAGPGGRDACGAWLDRRRDATRTPTCAASTPTAGWPRATWRADPFAMFQRWYDDAVAAEVYEPNAMVVASVSADGQPSARMVLLKGFSRGGLGLLHQPRLAQGHRAARQPALSRCCSPGTRWSGRCASTASRPSCSDATRSTPTSPPGRAAPGSGAHASHQSREVASRAELDDAWAAADAAYPDEVPVPDEWGGFRVVPEAVEFWQGRPGRMHDRLVYRRTDAGWTTHRLAP